MSTKVGNILGSGRAENDLLLDTAFVETSEYRSLAYAEDFHVVVGRRGTGKSALFRRLSEFYGSKRKEIVAVTDSVQEHTAMSISHKLTRACASYEHARAAMRIIWRVALLTQIAADLLLTRNKRPPAGSEWITSHFDKLEVKRTTTAHVICERLLTLVGAETVQELASKAARIGSADALQDLVTELLSDDEKRCIILVDRLDEGWAPDQVSTGIIGGLVHAATDLSEARTNVHAIVFVRDNIFRALAHFDPDYSRNIEDTTLRLSWSEESLLDFVAQRIRVALGLGDLKPLKVWERFAKDELAGRPGFREVLKLTLYRPRDMLALLNQAWQIASRASRNALMPDDVKAASKTISLTRLDDLKKEYRGVLPGIDDFVMAYQGTHVQTTYRSALDVLANNADTFAAEAMQSLALLGGASGVFLAMYSVGFFGVRNVGGEYEFSHDGANVGLRELSLENLVAVHPCYWQALDLQNADLPLDVVVRVHDEYGEPEGKETIRDQRLKQLGRVLTELDQIRVGAEDASRFEVWTHQAILVLFAGVLKNAELHPNRNAAQRRDIVATNNASAGFWKRVLDDYGCRQVVFEVKNYAELGPSEFNQAVAYGGLSYGKASFIVTRGTPGLEDSERAQIKSRYFGTQHLIVVLPAALLAQCLKKQRSASRIDYTEDTLGRLLDTYERRYLGVDAGTRKKRRGRRGRGGAKATTSEPPVEGGLSRPKTDGT